jgi:hypothetical protein
MTYDDAHILPRLSGFGKGVILSLPAGLAMALTGSATRKSRLVGGDKGRNKKTDSVLAGKPRPVGGELQKENRGRFVVIKDTHDEP